MKQIIDLADVHGLTTVIIAHERNFNDDSDSELLSPTVGSALSPSVATWLNGACDYICQTFKRQKEEIVNLKIGNKTKKTKRKTDEVEFCLRVGPHPVYMTGFRLPPGKELPDVVVNPDYAKIAALIG